MGEPGFPDEVGGPDEDDVLKVEEEEGADEDGMAAGGANEVRNTGGVLVVGSHVSEYKFDNKGNVLRDFSSLTFGFFI